MAQTDPVDAAQVLDRLPDWGRGSAGGGPRMCRLRKAGPWWGAAVVLAAPQVLIAALFGFLPVVDAAASVAGVSAACYVLATVLVGPDLPAWSSRLWLFSKVAGTAMTSLALAALISAGAFGLIVVIPAVPVAVVSAIGTGLVRRGFLPGAVLGIAAFSVLGALCTRPTFDGSGYDHAIVYDVGFAAFSVAAIIMVLMVTSAVSARRARHPEPTDDEAPDTV